MNVVSKPSASDRLPQQIARWGGHRLWHLGPIDELRKARYERRFAAARGNVRMFRGIYGSYAAAAASAPRALPLGWDNVPSAHRLEHERLRVYQSDYPVMFWLSSLLSANRFIFDLGGNVGTSYFAFRRLMTYPLDLTWLVQDVAAIVEYGRSLAMAEPAPGLRFTEDLAELPTADILLITGSVQFLEDPVRFLRSAGPLPRHILINKAPLYERESAVTLESNGVAFCPYHLLNRHQLIAALVDRGYRCVDAWRNYDLNCYVPFYPDHTIPFYSGYYLSREAE